MDDEASASVPYPSVHLDAPNVVALASGGLVHRVHNPKRAGNAFNPCQGGATRLRPHPRRGGPPRSFALRGKHRQPAACLTSLARRSPLARVSFAFLGNALILCLRPNCSKLDWSLASIALRFAVPGGYSSPYTSRASISLTAFLSSFNVSTIASSSCLRRSSAMSSICLGSLSDFLVNTSMVMFLPFLCTYSPRPIPSTP